MPAQLHISPVKRLGGLGARQRRVLEEWLDERFPGEGGGVGCGVGATGDQGQAGVAPVAPVAPILAPGFGAQGATPADLARRFGPQAASVIASESRSLLSAGPAALAETIADRAAQYREVSRG